MCIFSPSRWLSDPNVKGQRLCVCMYIIKMQPCLHTSHVTGCIYELWEVILQDDFSLSHCFHLNTFLCGGIVFFFSSCDWESLNSILGNTFFFRCIFLHSTWWQQKKPLIDLTTLGIRVVVYAPKCGNNIADTLFSAICWAVVFVFGRREEKALSPMIQ